MTSVYAGKQYMLRQFDTPPAVDVYPFYDGLSPYFDFVTNLWGFIDINGRKVVPAKYPAVHQFSEGLAAVQMPLESDAPLKWGFIDNTGKMVIAPRFSIEPNDFAYGYALVQKVSEAFVYIDKTGKVVSGEYERAENFYFGYAFVTDRETSTLHCINTDFEIANVGDECILMDDEYFWRGRKIHEYGAALDGYDFIGRRTRVLPWKYKGKEGDTHYSLAAQAAITSGPMIEIATDDYIAYADLNGKVIFALFRNEF